MKYLFIVALMTSFITTASFAAESETDCPMMREDTSRTNPKLSINSTNVETSTKTKGVSAQ